MLHYGLFEMDEDLHEEMKIETIRLNIIKQRYILLKGALAHMILVVDRSGKIMPMTCIDTRTSHLHYELDKVPINLTKIPIYDNVKIINKHLEKVRNQEVVDTRSKTKTQLRK